MLVDKDGEEGLKAWVIWGHVMIQSMLSETLNSRELARALACLILQRNVKLLGMEDRNGQGEGSSDKPQGSSSSSYQDVTDYVQRELQE